MSYQCDVCGKRRLKGHKVSHSNIKTNRVQRPNLQVIRARVDGKVRRIKICTRCLRSSKVEKVI